MNTIKADYLIEQGLIYPEEANSIGINWILLVLWACSYVLVSLCALAAITAASAIVNGGTLVTHFGLKLRRQMVGQ